MLGNFPIITAALWLQDIPCAGPCHSLAAVRSAVCSRRTDRVCSAAAAGRVLLLTDSLPLPRRLQRRGPAPPGQRGTLRLSGGSTGAPVSAQKPCPARISAQDGPSPAVTVTGLCEHRALVSSTPRDTAAPKPALVSARVPRPSPLDGGVGDPVCPCTGRAFLTSSARSALASWTLLATSAF